MSDQLLVWLVAGGVILAILALAVAAAALAAVSRVRGAPDQRRVRGVVSGRPPGPDARDREIAELRRRLDEQAGERAELRGALRAAVSRTATIRYDAFRESGGQLSSSTALLDADGNGVVLTSINGRSEGRTYAKSVTGGHSHTPLSDEETEAIRLAMSRPHIEFEPAAVGAGGDPATVRASVLRPAARSGRRRQGRRPGPKTVL